MSQPRFEVESDGHGRFAVSGDSDYYEMTKWIAEQLNNAGGAHPATSDQDIRLECLKLAAARPGYNDPRILGEVFFDWVKTGRRRDPCRPTSGSGQTSGQPAPGPEA